MNETVLFAEGPSKLAWGDEEMKGVLCIYPVGRVSSGILEGVVLEESFHEAGV